MYRVCLLVLLCCPALVAMDTQNNDTTPIPEGCIFTEIDDYLGSSKGFILKNTHDPIAIISTFMLDGPKTEMNTANLKQIQKTFLGKIKDIFIQASIDNSIIEEIVGAWCNVAHFIPVKHQGSIQIIKAQTWYQVEFKENKGIMYKRNTPQENLENETSLIASIFTKKSGLTKSHEIKVNDILSKQISLNERAKKTLALLGPKSMISIVDVTRVAKELKKIAN